MANGINHRKRNLRDYQSAPMPQLALNSPPYYPPLQIHPESAVRFHQTPRPTYAPFQFDQPQREGNASLDSDSPALASPYPAPAVLHPSSHLEKPPSEPGRECESPLAVNVSNHVHNTNDDSDGVYLFNCHPDSYSTVLDDKEETTPAERAQTEAQLELALIHLRKAQQLSDQYRKDSVDRYIEVQSPALTPLETSKHDDTWQQDLRQRNFMRQIKAQIKAGGSLLLEYMSPSLCAVQCAHTECVQPARLVPFEEFYLTVEGLDKSGNGKSFCLVCLEQVWNGHGMRPPLENPAVFSRGPRKIEATGTILVAAGINLDGQDNIVNERRDSALSLRDDDLACDCDPEINGNPYREVEPCDDHFSDPPIRQAGNDLGEIATSHVRPSGAAGSDLYPSSNRSTPTHGSRQPVEPLDWPHGGQTTVRDHAAVGQPPHASHQRSASPDDMMWEASTSRRTSQSSTDSNGKWRYPPTRFQELAAYIQPGENISARDKAALRLWKAASGEQLQWQAHLERTEQLRRKFAGLLSKEEEDEDDWLYADVAISGDSASNASEHDEDVDENTRSSGRHAGDDSDDTNEDFAELAGLSKKQCYGRNLSTVLALSRNASAACD